MFPRGNSEHTRRASDADPEPLGLSIIYASENGHKVDIVFVHGVGGFSRKTWYKNEDPELFWPLKSTSLEPDVHLARMFASGYYANTRTAGHGTISVLDFAKDLLYDLRYAKDEQKENLNIGSLSRLASYSEMN